MTAPKLGKLYRLEEFQADWARYFSMHWKRAPREFYVATEVVVTKPEMVVPQVARAYNTDLFNYKGHAVTCDWLSGHAARMGVEWRGCANDMAQDVVMVEVWEDHGDDGHVAYNITGFRFVPVSALELLSTHWCFTGFPECMLWQWFDDSEEAG